MRIHLSKACIWQKKNTDVNSRTSRYEYKNKYVQTNEQKS